MYEAVYHFNLYMFLQKFIESFKGRVYPEFPTGNGKIDIIIQYAGRMYGVEVKSYTNHAGYKEALGQAAGYGKQLGLAEISIAFFVEAIDEASRAKYEKEFMDGKTGVKVLPVFVATGA